jgi:hypothetical protein
MSTTNFFSDIEKGREGELIFKTDFLDFLDIKYTDVTGSKQFQVIDSDYQTKIGLYEIKANYKDDGFVIFEDYTNIEPEFGVISYGWIYKTGADMIVFISTKTRIMIFLPFNQCFKDYYFSYICNSTDLIRNKISEKGDTRWQSAYRKVPLEMLKGYVSSYKKSQP